ncbi:LysR substrate-binding domain-containing protein [Nocardioides convexus]|uniref:LysR substrate-binding domain-containing protein n=1 Tax=Nocardioides convexus TaxID=2712224 RepID=UPI0024187D2C|nr:LysR substrate-binding domain-containing protein [Nocardioides convexus]
MAAGGQGAVRIGSLPQCQREPPAAGPGPARPLSRPCRGAPRRGRARRPGPPAARRRARPRPRLRVRRRPHPVARPAHPHRPAARGACSSCSPAATASPTHRRSTSPSLAGERWASSLEGTAGSRTLDRLCAARGFAPRVDYRSNDYTVLRGIVAAGVCVALVPALSHTSDQGVRPLPLSAVDAGRQVHVLRRTDDPNPLLPPVLDALVRASRAQGRHLRGVRPATP